MISDALGRLAVRSVKDLGWATKVIAEFEYPDTRGVTQVGCAKFLVPPTAGPYPLCVEVGYELRDDVLQGLVAFGCLVANPMPPRGVWSEGAAPGRRSVNLDVALLHIARSLDCIDDSRVVIAGASNGGYLAWMLTAETFPLAGSMPETAEVNAGHLAWYLATNQRLQADLEPPIIPAVAKSYRVLAKSVARYDCDSDIWLQHSPVAHAACITAPVHAVHATSDTIVPVEQVARSLARPPEGMPDGYTTCGEEPWLFLEDVFPDLHLERVPVPPGAPVLELEAGRAAGWLQSRSRDKAQATPGFVTLPTPNARVVVCILEDGGPGPRVGHTRHAVRFGHGAFIAKVLSRPADAAGQLTDAKRRMLEDRARGVEWIRSPMRHLDFPEAERADVARAFSHVPDAADVAPQLAAGPG